MSAKHYLIIGNGAAGLSAAEVIRQRDKEGRVTILTNEPHLFYSRPGIAYYINNQIPEKQLFSRGQDFYKEHRIGMRHAVVTAIDARGKRVKLQSGEWFAYDVLLLATGASAVPPSFPGGDLDGVVTFDNLDDARRVIEKGRRAKAAVVVGGGITAMELAEGLQAQGARTHLLQRGNRIWPRLFDQRESEIIAHEIEHEGIQIHYGEEVEEITGRNGNVAGVRLKSGGEIKCQVVGVAIGVRPNLKLARDLPIKIERGIIVNPHMQSDEPTIFAAGDVAQVLDRWTGQHHLDVLWPSAINEGRAAGYNMVDVAHGRQPAYSYMKGSPFNAAMLFGVHLTVIGRVGSRDDDGDVEELSHLSRGSSHVWTSPFTAGYRSAWDSKGPNSLRIAMNEGRIVGALILGNQELADPLRRLVEEEVDLSRYQQAILNADGDLPGTILKAWRDWHESWG